MKTKHPQILVTIAWFIEVGKKSLALTPAEGPSREAGGMLQLFARTWLMYEVGNTSAEAFSQIDAALLAQLGEDAQSAAQNGGDNELAGFLLSHHAAHILHAIQTKNEEALAYHQEMASIAFHDHVSDPATYGVEIVTKLLEEVEKGGIPLP